MKADEKSCEIPGRPTDTDLKQDEFIPVWPQGDGKAFAGKAFPVNAGLKNIDGASAVNLTLPKAIYGITGVELQIRLDNLFLLHDRSQAEVKINTPVGVCENRVWRYTAEKPGRYPASVEVTDAAGRQLGYAETEIVISDASAGNDQNISMLMIGDSLFAGAQCAGALFENMHVRGNKNFTLIGSHSGVGKPLALVQNGICENCRHNNIFCDGFCMKADHAEQHRVFYGKEFGGNDRERDYWGRHRLSVCNDYEPDIYVKDEMKKEE